MTARVAPRIELDDRTPLESVIPLATPYVVFVDPASACNFKCVFCPTGHPDLVAETGRFVGAMRWSVFAKVVDDLEEFDRPIRVLRLYKDGEPFLNKRLADMVRYAKRSGAVGRVDTTTNASLMTPERLGPVLEAGIDRINVSIDGMDAAAYARFTKTEVDFDQIVRNVRWLYDNRGSCEVVVKTIGEVVPEEDRARFFDTFGECCDRIFVENFAPCWPEFDIEARAGADITTGLYGQEIKDVDVCAYIFYSIAVNADGLVSSCFQDWERRLVVGDARRQSVKDIWNSDEMNSLRFQHLDGRRRDLDGPCKDCGQLTHCMPSNVDAHREALLEKFKSEVGTYRGGLFYSARDRHPMKDEPCVI